MPAAPLRWLTEASTQYYIDGFSGEVRLEVMMQATHSILFMAILATVFYVAIVATARRKLQFLGVIAIIGIWFYWEIREEREHSALLGSELAYADNARLIDCVDDEIIAATPGLKHEHSKSGGMSAGRSLYDEMTATDFYFEESVPAPVLQDVANRMESHPEVVKWQRMAKDLGLQRECRFVVRAVTGGPKHEVVPGRWVLRMLFHESNYPGVRRSPSTQDFYDNNWPQHT